MSAPRHPGPQWPWALVRMRYDHVPFPRDSDKLLELYRTASSERFAEVNVGTWRMLLGSA